MEIKTKILAAVVALTVAVPAFAAEDPGAEQAAAKHYNTAVTTIGDLLADPAAKAVLDKHIPGLSDNPSIGMAAAMTLRAIQPMAADKFTVEQLDAIDADLAKIPMK